MSSPTNFGVSGLWKAILPQAFGLLPSEPDPEHGRHISAQWLESIE